MCFDSYAATADYMVRSESVGAAMHLRLQFRKTKWWTRGKNFIFHSYSIWDVFQFEIEPSNHRYWILPDCWSSISEVEAIFALHPIAWSHQVNQKPIKINWKERSTQSKSAMREQKQFTINWWPHIITATAAHINMYSIYNKSNHHHNKKKCCMLVEVWKHTTGNLADDLIYFCHFTD